MRIGYSRMLGAAALAAALSIGGSARAADPAAELKTMCEVCTSQFPHGECYDYTYKSTKPDPEPLTCTFPPCWTTSKTMTLAAAKMICADCRALCPDTPRPQPAAATTGSKGAAPRTPPRGARKHPAATPKK